MKRRQFLTGTLATTTMLSLAGCTSEISQEGITVDQSTDIQPLDYSIELRNTMSEQKPPSLQVEVTNTGDSEITLGDSRDLFKFSSGSYQTKVANIAELEYSESGWYITERTARTTEFQTITLQPGQSESRTVYIVKTQRDVSSENLEYPQRFESVVLTQTELNNVESGERLQWGFTLSESVLLGEQ